MTQQDSCSWGFAPSVTSIKVTLSSTLQGDLGLNAFAFSPDFNLPGEPGYQKLYVSSSQRQANGAPIDRVEEYLMSEPDGTVPKNASNQPERRGTAP